MILSLLLAAACNPPLPVDTGPREDTQVVTCVDQDGGVRAQGETWDAGDGCNTCTCDEYGDADCTDLGCP